MDWALLETAVALGDHRADVLLLEAGDMPRDKLSALAEEASLPVLMLLETSDTELVTLALRSGIRGVISPEATPEEIEGAIQAVNVGLAVIALGSIPDLLRDAHPAEETLADPLSGRELEVLNSIAEGLSNKLIAHRLGISEHTVKTHVASILAKLGAASRTEAVSQAIRRGLVML